MASANRNKLLCLIVLAAMLLATGTAVAGWRGGHGCGGRGWGRCGCWDYCWPCFDYCPCTISYFPCYPCPTLCSCGCYWPCGGGININPVPSGGINVNPGGTPPSGGGGINTSTGSDGNLKRSSQQASAPTTEHAGEASQPTAKPAEGSASATLTLSVPEDATVVVNGRKTTTTGEQRTYMCRRLQPGQRYRFLVSIQVVREGKVQETAREVYLVGGASEPVVLNFLAKPSAEVAAITPQ